jgi:hypothetical protein
MDPDAKTSFAYAMNKKIWKHGIPSDPRTVRLNNTFNKVLGIL